MTTTQTLIQDPQVGQRVYLVSNGSRYDRLSQSSFEIVKVTPTTITIGLPWATQDADKTRTYRKYTAGGGYLTGRYMAVGTDEDPWRRDYLVAETDPMVAIRDWETRTAVAKREAQAAAEKFARTLDLDDMVTAEAAAKYYWIVLDERPTR
jgi:hypothetical protein